MGVVYKCPNVGVVCIMGVASRPKNRREPSHSFTRSSSTSSSTKLTKMEGCTETYGRPLFFPSCGSFLRSLQTLLGLAFLVVSLLPCLSCGAGGGEFDISTSTYVLIYWF